MAKALQAYRAQGVKARKMTRQANSLKAGAALKYGAGQPVGGTIDLVRGIGRQQRADKLRAQSVAGATAAGHKLAAVVHKNPISQAYRAKAVKARDMKRYSSLMKAAGSFQIGAGGLIAVTTGETGVGLLVGGALVVSGGVDQVRGYIREARANTLRKEAVAGARVGMKARVTQAKQTDARPSSDGKPAGNGSVKGFWRVEKSGKRTWVGPYHRGR